MIPTTSLTCEHFFHLKFSFCSHWSVTAPLLSGLVRSRPWPSGRRLSRDWWISIFRRWPSSCATRYTFLSTFLITMLSFPVQQQLLSRGLRYLESTWAPKKHTIGSWNFLIITFPSLFKRYFWKVFLTLHQSCWKIKPIASVDLSSNLSRDPAIVKMYRFSFGHRVYSWTYFRYIRYKNFESFWTSDSNFISFSIHPWHNHFDIFFSFLLHTYPPFVASGPPD